MDTSADASTDSASPPADASRPALLGGARLVDPRSIDLDRTIGAIFGAIVSFGYLVAILVVWLAAGWPTWAITAFAAGWIPLTALLVWLALGWPAIEYRYRRYRVDADAIEIVSGVVWRSDVVVPRSRVQHIDVSQGPLERSYDLATLSIYTAGTEYSRVDIPGLNHAVALTVRDALLPKDAEGAV